jgi:hypothetical protein
VSTYQRVFLTLQRKQAHSPTNDAATAFIALRDRFAAGVAPDGERRCLLVLVDKPDLCLRVLAARVPAET